MTKQERIQAAMKALAQPKSHYDSAALLLGIVRSVKGMDTAEVEVDGLLYHDVQIQAIASGSGKSIVTVPAVGSKCLIASIEHGAGYVLLCCDEIDKIEGEVQGGKLKIDNTGVSYEKQSMQVSLATDGIDLKIGTNSLGGLIDELISAIAKLTVTTSAGVSTVPVNLAEFISLQTKFKLLLK